MPLSGIFFGLLLIAGQTPADNPESGSYKISTDVTRVLLPVIVKDGGGELVRGLAKENFTILEDGSERQIRFFSSEDIPVTVGLVMDNSSSMRGKKREAILAALTFMRMSNEKDEMFVVNFNEKASLGLPQEIPATGDSNRLIDALNVQPPDGRTALYDAIALGIEHLAVGTCDKRALVVVSDGGDNASRRSLHDVLKLAQTSDAIIYTIGIFAPSDPDRNPGVLKKLARLTGGEAYLPVRLMKLRDICVHIARDLRNQYLLGFEPPRSSEDSRAFHRIEVIARGPEGRRLRVRTRSGYFSTGETSAGTRSAP